MRRVPVKPWKRTISILTILLTLAAGSSVFFGVNMLAAQRAQSEAAASYQAIRGVTGMTVAQTSAVSATPVPTASVLPIVPTDAESTALAPEGGVGSLAAVHTPEEERALQNIPDFSALQAMNKDIVGWIYQEGTEIDYPILYSTQRGYYLTRLYDGQENKHGSIYIDPLNSATLSDRNTLIYGHNMKDETMFGSLYRYKEQAYFDSHPRMVIYTPGHTWMLELFAVNSINTNDTVPQTNIDSDLALSRYVTQAKNDSLVQCALLPKSDDAIVTLVTCSTRDFLRLLVLGRLREL